MKDQWHSSPLITGPVIPDGRRVVCSYVPSAVSNMMVIQTKSGCQGGERGAETENGVGDDVGRARASVGMASEGRDEFIQLFDLCTEGFHSHRGRFNG